MHSPLAVLHRLPLPELSGPKPSGNEVTPAPESRFILTHSYPLPSIAQMSFGASGFHSSKLPKVKAPIDQTPSPAQPPSSQLCSSCHGSGGGGHDSPPALASLSRPLA
eukprot:8338926-Pyramimonas_sp.AAC.1